MSLVSSMHFPSLAARAAVVSAAALLFVHPSVLPAQDSASSQKPESSAESTDDADALKQWDEVAKRKQEISEKLQKLRTDFATADADGKTKIRDEYTALVNEFQDELLPKIEKLAPQVYKQKPDDIDAAEYMLSRAFDENKYEEAAKIADRLIAADHATDFVVNVAGASHFAIHNFEQAHKVLSQARENGRLDGEIGAKYLDASKEYVDLWKREQELREQQADKQLPHVLLKTTRGDVELELFEEEAPNTVANFISLVEKKVYDGTKFHRVIPQFMAQGGDPNSKDDEPGNDGSGGPGHTIKCECYRDDARMHFRGSLSMAHAGKDTGGSQFFLTHLPTPWLNVDTDRESGHTVFGRVVKGMDVVAAIEKGDEIQSATVISKRDHDYKPETMPE